MTRAAGSRDPRQLELEICEAIGAQRMLELDDGGFRRVVQPYCRGFTRKGAETLRAVQVSSYSGSSGRAFGKPAPRPNGSG
ncbi:MAG TPA: hypothetical protein VHO06_18950 [Polyangia bacterium]|nr:hypothetical protein [Polyangia bacterium]